MFTPSAQPWIRKATAVFLGLVAGFVFLFPAASVRAQPAPQYLVFQNLQHTILVRKAFLADKELAPLNLGAKVENRIAYLWGTVPSQHLLDKAFAVVEKLPDIADVRSKIYVEQPQPEESAWAATPAPPNPPPVVSHLPDAKGEDAREETETGTTSPAASTWWKPLPEAEETPVANRPPPTQPAWQPPAPAGENTSFKAASNELPNTQPEDQGLFVLPAIAVPDGQKQNGAGIQLAIPLTLQERIKGIQDNSTRYQTLRVFVQKRTVYVEGKVREWADLHRFTQSVSQLPGVGNVVIGRVGLERSE